METLDISFTADADAIVRALETVQIVEPPGLDEEGRSGFLFVVGKKVDRKQDEEGNVVVGPDDGKDFCWVYSRDAIRAARSEFPIREVQGEGAFVYPSAYIKSFRNVSGTELNFTIHSETDGPTYNGIARWSFGAGAGTERPLIDPRLAHSLDKKLGEAKNYQKFWTALLKEAIKKGTYALADSKDRNAKDEYKIFTIYDPSIDKSGKGDGTLWVTDAYRRLYFQCDEFKGHALQIHSENVSKLEAFLERCGHEILVATGTEMTYAMTLDKSQVFGWSRYTKPPLDYKGLPRSWDKVILMVKDRDKILRQLTFIRDEMEKGRDKIELEYDAEKKHLRFHIRAGGKSTSLPIDIEIPRGEDGNELPTFSYKYDVSVIQLIELFKDVRSTVVEFRMFPMEGHGGADAKDGAGFRTIDEYWIDKDGGIIGGSGMATPPEGGFLCRVTRFMPNKK